MKPGDHPEFFRFPAPPGRSRESTIRLDAEGRFFHDDEPVEHAKLADAMHAWIARHPDDGRYILTNGYDWTYFTVDDVPYFVRTVSRDADGAVVLGLSDGTREELDPKTLREGSRGELRLQVKATAPGGPFDAKLTRHAQTTLGELLIEGPDGVPVLEHRGAKIPLRF
jgi:uncharacterized protein